MTNPIDTTPQMNFLPGNLPPKSEAFYNSKGFAKNQTEFLSTLIKMDEKAQAKGLKDIKEAIES